MKATRDLMIWLMALLLGACSTSQSICRGPLRPINVHTLPVQGRVP